MKEHPKLVTLPNLRVIGLNAKVWLEFKNRENNRAQYGLEGLHTELSDFSDFKSEPCPCVQAINNQIW